MLFVLAIRTGDSRGFAFVRYKYKDEAHKAVERLDGKKIVQILFLLVLLVTGFNMKRLYSFQEELLMAEKLLFSLQSTVQMLKRCKFLSFVLIVNCHLTSVYSQFVVVGLPNSFHSCIATFSCFV